MAQKIERHNSPRFLGSK